LLIFINILPVVSFGDDFGFSFTQLF